MSGLYSRQSGEGQRWLSILVRSGIAQGEAKSWVGASLKDPNHVDGIAVLDKREGENRSFNQGQCSSFTHGPVHSTRSTTSAPQLGITNEMSSGGVLAL